MSRRSIALAFLTAVTVATLALSQTAAADDKVTICHIPPGNPDNRHLITVSADAVPAHLAHGDNFGDPQDDFCFVPE